MTFPEVSKSVELVYSPHFFQANTNALFASDPRRSMSPLLPSPLTAPSLPLPSGRALTFTGEHKDWLECAPRIPGRLKHCVGLRWRKTRFITVAAVVKQSFEEHNPQLYLALAMLCKRSALVTVKNTEVNNGPEAWRGLNATYDSNNKGRQRVRMQCLLQP